MDDDDDDNNLDLYCLLLLASQQIKYIYTEYDVTNTCSGYYLQNIVKWER